MNKHSPNLKKGNFSTLPTTKLTDKMVYEHYTNGVYNGIKRVGRRYGCGITLFDNGRCAITNYNKDQKYHNHNIFLQNRRLISVWFENGAIKQLVCRVDGFLIYLKYEENTQKLNGNSYLIDYVNSNIFVLCFEHGLFKSKKQNKEKDLKKKVFQNNNLLSIIGQNHNDAINYKFYKSEICSFKTGNKVQVSYSKNQFPYGLGFTFTIRGSHGGFNPELNQNEDSFELKYVEKGIYNNNNIDGFGEKMFKNGNIYVGGFKSDIFNGFGILKNLQKGNWVYGKFQKGQLSQMIDYQNEGNIKSSEQYMLEIHKKYEKFNNERIQEFDFSFIDLELQKFVNNEIIQEEKSLAEKKKETLKMIQEHFTKDQDHELHKYFKPILKKQTMNNEKKQILKINSFISQNKNYSQFYQQQSQNSSYRKTFQDSLKSKNSIHKESSVSKSKKRIFKQLANSSLTPSKIKKTDGVQSIIKLHKINSIINDSRKKKYPIFEQKSSSKEKKRQKSPPRPNSKSRKKSRSPIFPSYDVSPRSSMHTERKKSPTSIKQNSSLKHWNSIRKEAIERKSSIRKSPRKGKIFDNEVKTSNSPKRFHYEFEEDNGFQS